MAQKVKSPTKPRVSGATSRSEKLKERKNAIATLEKCKLHSERVLYIVKDLHTGISTKRLIINHKLITNETISHF